MTPHAERHHRAPRLLCAWLALGAPVAAVAQQTAEPCVRVVVAAAATRDRLPGYAELCGRHLPGLLAEAPRELPATAFALEWTATGLRLLPGDWQLPSATVALGSCRVGDGPALLWNTSVDGVEDWFVPAGFTVPAAWRALLDAAELNVGDAPCTLSAATLVGQLAGALLHGDPFAELLQGTAAACGEATWLALRDGDGLRVRARGDGGLALPAALALLAARSGPAPAPRALRAFANRDMHRGEAARQLLRTTTPGSRAVLRALLHADDDTALVAIDGLVRTGDTGALPLIVAAASAERPACTLAAVDAVRSLWPAADALDRQRTRGALARSAQQELRRLDVAALSGPSAVAEPVIDGRSRTLLWLSLTSLATLMLWLRSRHDPALATV